MYRSIVIFYVATLNCYNYYLLCGIILIFFFCYITKWAEKHKQTISMLWRNILIRNGSFCKLKFRLWSFELSSHWWLFHAQFHSRIVIRINHRPWESHFTPQKCINVSKKSADGPHRLPDRSKCGDGKVTVN